MQTVSCRAIGQAAGASRRRRLRAPLAGACPGAWLGETPSLCPLQPWSCTLRDHSAYLRNRNEQSPPDFHGCDSTRIAIAPPTPPASTRHRLGIRHAQQFGLYLSLVFALHCQTIQSPKYRASSIQTQAHIDISNNMVQINIIICIMLL